MRALHARTGRRIQLALEPEPSCLIETIEYLAQKVSGIRSYAHANPASLNATRRDHVEMIEALRHSRRDDLIALTRRHLGPAAQAYIRAYRQRFGDNA